MLGVVLAAAAFLRFGLDATPAPAATPAAASSASQVSTAPQAAWLGVSLGESARDVRAQLGKPREIVSASVGDVWRYDADNGNVTLELIIDQGEVVNIAARLKPGMRSTLADPAGGALGMTQQALQAARGAPLATYDNGASIAYGEAAGIRWFYSLDGGVVDAIEVSSPLPSPPPAQVLGDRVHDGSTVERALTVNAATQTDSTSAELAYLRQLTCDDGGRVQITGDELVSAGGRFYDLYHTQCSTTKQPHDYYFDVTAGFGK